MPDSPHVKINLIGKQKITLGEDFLRWAVKAGRIIIVVTELIALGALLYRFTIDRKIIDLHDKIKNEQLLVESQKPKETTYRSIQSRLDNVKTIQEETKAKINIMNSIVSSISDGDFTSTNITVDQNTIEVQGVAFSIFPINAFIDTLKKDPNVTSISLDDVTSSNQGVGFKMSLEIKGPSS